MWAGGAEVLLDVVDVILSAVFSPWLLEEEEYSDFVGNRASPFEPTEKGRDP